MGFVKIETRLVGPAPKLFHYLGIGETFRYGNNLYLKIGTSTAFNFDKIYCVGFNDLESVVPVNSKLVVEE